MNNDEPRVTGVGGIFFKTENPDKTKGSTTIFVDKGLGHHEKRGQHF
jgi:hypothetical protein